MALHTGAAQEREGDYYGPAVNRAARLMAIGHGGQVLLSEVTQGLNRADRSRLPLWFGAAYCPAPTCGQVCHKAYL